MAEQQMDRAAKDAAAKLPDGRRRSAIRSWSRSWPPSKPRRPEPLPLAMSVSDVGREGPPTYRLLAGDWRKPKEQVTPGFPEFLGGGDANARRRRRDGDSDRPAFRAGASG